MMRLIARRLLALGPTLLIVTFGVFMLVQLAPNDASIQVAGGSTATAEDIARVREELGLDDPIVSQYLRWLANAVTGDLGDSYIRRTAVTDDLANRVPVTLSLLFASTVVAVVLAVPLGISSGLRPNGVIDQGARVFASLAIAIPSFLLGLVLVIVFAVKLNWLPSSGYEKFTNYPLEWLRDITLPAIALGVAISAAIMRQLRGALVDELDTNHIRTVWAIGGTSARVVGRHGLKNAASPAITILGLQIAALVGGAVIIEQIFGIPGLGSYLLSAITQADIPAIQGCVLVMVIIQMAMSLTVDIAYALLNPKVRVSA
jgi:peptide/nickel transport system permease protein